MIYKDAFVGANNGILIYFVFHFDVMKLFVRYANCKYHQIIDSSVTVD